MKPKSITRIFEVKIIFLAKTLMKKRYLSLFAWVWVMLVGCSTYSTQSDETEILTESPEQTLPNTNALNSNQSALLSVLLGKSTATTLRGIALGDPITKVSSQESFELFEEEGDHLGYTYETEQLETIDVLYYHSGTSQVQRIQLDVYLNSKAATDELLKATREHFTALYGAPKQSSDQKTAWTQAKVRVRVEDVSENKDFGITIVMEPSQNPIVLSSL